MAVVSVTTLQLQRDLYVRGFDPGPLDGIFGSRTLNATQLAANRVGYGAIGGLVVSSSDRNSVEVNADLLARIQGLPIVRELPSGSGAVRPRVGTATGSGGTTTTGSGTPAGGGTTTTGGGGTTIGPSLDVPPPSLPPVEEGGINWPLVLGVGVAAFGVGWFFLGRKKRQSGTAGLGRARRRRRTRRRTR